MVLGVRVCPRRDLSYFCITPFRSGVPVTPVIAQGLQRGLVGGGICDPLKPSASPEKCCIEELTAECDHVDRRTMFELPQHNRGTSLTLQTCPPSALGEK